MDFKTPLHLKKRRKYKSNFLESLFSILENKEFGELVSWSEDGSFFRITDRELFSKKLNMYRFSRKLESNGESIQFCNPLFVRGRVDLINQIQRKPAFSHKSQKLDQDESRSELEASDERHSYETESTELLETYPHSKQIHKEHPFPPGHYYRHEEMQNYFNMNRTENITCDQSCFFNQNNSDSGFNEFCSDEIAPAAADDIFSNKELYDFLEKKYGDNHSSSNRAKQELPQGFDTFRAWIEKILRFEEIDKKYESLSLVELISDQSLL